MAAVDDLSLKKFLATYPSPQVAKVTQGYCTENDDDEQDISTNDVLKVLSVQCPKVSLEARRNNNEFRATVSTRNATRFRLHVPEQLREFSGVQELCEQWPLTVEALKDHEPPLRPTQARRPPVEFVKGDVLHLVRLNDSKSQLQCRKNASPDIIRLSVDYVGRFREVVDITQLYTLGELAATAPVARELVLLPRDQQRLNGAPAPWIDNIPSDFSGRVTMRQPEYLVEVSLIVDDDEQESSSATLADPVMLSLDSDIRLQARDPDYACVTHHQYRLRELIAMPARRLQRIVRIVEWEEETTPLHNHSVRPGQLLVFFERVTVAKLAVSRDSGSDTVGRRHRHLLVPLSHGGQFRRAWGSSPPAPFRLTDLSRSPFGYPFTLTYHEEAEYRNLEDDLLPAGHALRADAIVDEDCVLVARISEFDALTAARPATADDARLVNAEDAFHLPLRTRLTVCLGERLRRPVRRVASCRDDFAEQMSETTYNKLVGLQPAVEVEVGYVRPTIRPRISPAATLQDLGGNCQAPAGAWLTTATRRWSPPFPPRVPSRRVLRHHSLAAADGHVPTPPAPRARPGGGGTDSDSSTDDHGYTALDLNSSRRHRSSVTAAVLRPRQADDDRDDNDDDDDDDDDD